VSRNNRRPGRLRRYIICTSPQILLGQSSSIRWARNVACMEEKDIRVVLVSKPVENLQLGSCNVELVPGSG
jgi:hypothetical protein